MEWTPGGVSNDIEDRRSEGGGGGFGFGGGFGGMHIGIGGAILLGILSLVFHQNLFQLLPGGGGSTDSPSGGYADGRQGGAPVAGRQPDTAQDQGENREVQFVSFVLDDVQKNWDRVLPQQEHVAYQHAHLVLFRNAIRSGCGQASMATGPFYCPEDQKVYLDLGFFNELSRRFGAPGEFAQAYVIAHEIGHHVQKLLGIEGKVHRLQQQEPGEANPLSVRLELQADCLAGVWGNSTEQRNIINQTDVTSAINAAAAVGDDRLQRMGQGYVNPETFTHGSSADRKKWFQRGLESGQIASCNTFQ